MATFSVTEFQQTIANKGLARQNRFQVLIPNLVDGELISLLCQSSNMPGATVQVKRQTLFGPSFIRPASINYGETVQMSFLVDKNMNVRKIFDGWIHSIINPSSFTVNYKDEYARDIIIYQLDEGENITYSLRLVDAFPISLGSLSVNQAALDRFHILPVTFSYRYWETIDISNSETFDPLIDGPNQKLKVTQPKIAPPIRPDASEAASNAPGSVTEGGSFGNLGPI